MYSSARDIINPQDYQMPSFGDFSAAPGNYGLGAEVADFFGGQRSGYREEYNRLQSILDRQYDLDMDNTKFQRAFKDIEAAGYNPWLLLQNGGLSSPGTSSGSSGYSVKDKQKGTNLGMFALTAAKLLAILAA